VRVVLDQLRFNPTPPCLSSRSICSFIVTSASPHCIYRIDYELLFRSAGQVDSDRRPLSELPSEQVAPSVVQLSSCKSDIAARPRDVVLRKAKSPRRSQELTLCSAVQTYPRPSQPDHADGHAAYRIHITYRQSTHVRPECPVAFAILPNLRLCETHCPAS
jgi:hypothetical protein